MSSRTSPRTERQLIKQIQALSSSKVPPMSRVVLSIGDDAAAFSGKREYLTLVSTDALVEGIHFDLAHCSAQDVGWKALAVNLSDIAAVGGTPLYFTTSIALPRSLPSQFALKIYRGIQKLARSAGVGLVGGDTCSSPTCLFLDVTIIGEVKPSELVTRCGARPGDALFVTGELGASAVGLEILRTRPTISNGRRALSKAIGRHLRPIPRHHVARFLASRHYATAMIDVSDGLSTDLHHLCEQSQVGAIVNSEHIPLARIPSEVASLLSRPLLDYAMNGGEDYELLFAVAPRVKDKIPNAIREVSIHEIGQITKRPECWLSNKGRLMRLRPAGFDHFAQPDRENRVFSSAGRNERKPG